MRERESKGRESRGACVPGAQPLPLLQARSRWALLPRRSPSAAAASCLTLQGTAVLRRHFARAATACAPGSCP